MIFDPEHQALVDDVLAELGQMPGVAWTQDVQASAYGVDVRAGTEYDYALINVEAKTNRPHNRNFSVPLGQLHRNLRRTDGAVLYIFRDVAGDVPNPELWPHGPGKGEGCWWVGARDHGVGRLLPPVPLAVYVPPLGRAGQLNDQVMADLMIAELWPHDPPHIDRDVQPHGSGQPFVVYAPHQCLGGNNWQDMLREVVASARRAHV